MKNVDEIEILFDKDRLELTTKLNNLIKNLNQITLLGECQVIMLSLRTSAIEKVAGLQNAFYKKSAELKAKQKDKTFYYRKPEDMDFTIKNGDERTALINADLAVDQLKLDLIQAHIQFNKGCIDTLDKIGYAIKTKVEINRDLS